MKKNENLKKKLMSLGLAATLATTGASGLNSAKAEDTADYTQPEYETPAIEYESPADDPGHVCSITWYTDPYGVEYGICDICNGIRYKDHVHVPGEQIVIDQGTCWHSGQTITVCRSCNTVLESIDTGLRPDRHISKLSSHWSALGPEEWLHEVSCTDEGVYGQRCASCNAEIVKFTIPAEGHVFIKENDVEATCEKDGYTGKEYCEYCGEVAKEREIIPAHGHISGVVRRETDPTCSTEGLDVAECKYCGIPMIRPVAPIGHVYDIWKTEIPASSTQEGLESRECVYCHDKETRKVPKKKHDCSIDGHLFRSEGKGDIPYDFTASLKEYVGPTACDDYWETLNDWCLECGYEKLVSRTFKKGMGHHFKWTVTKEATETEEGLKTGTCPSCGTVTTEIIPKIEHKHDCDIDGHISGVVRRETDPTCTTEGLDVAECQYCGLRMIRPVDALGHDYKWTYTFPTIYSEGVKTGTCSTCGDVVKLIVPKDVSSNHVHCYVVTKEAIAPTFEYEGRTEEITCLDCGNVIKSKVLPKIDDNYKIGFRVTLLRKRIDRMLMEIGEDTMNSEALVIFEDALNSYLEFADNIDRVYSLFRPDSREWYIIENYNKKLYLQAIEKIELALAMQDRLLSEYYDTSEDFRRGLDQDMRIEESVRVKFEKEGYPHDMERGFALVNNTLSALEQIRLGYKENVSMLKK